MNVYYTTFEVSGNCNMGCEFCISNWRENRDILSSEEVKRGIDVLCECGLKAINLTGGEPLLRNDIVEICRYAKSKGLYTIISTNGILLKEKIDLLKYIDAINLPLDSVDAEVHNKMRPNPMKNHHSHILSLIDLINKDYPNIKIKINTMVGKPNYSTVLKIGELINGKVFRWKLGKFNPSGYGEKFKQKFDISLDDFIKLKEKIESIYSSTLMKEEMFKFDESFVFIDCRAHIMKVEENNTIKDLGYIENLPILPNLSSYQNHFERFYTNGESK